MYTVASLDPNPRGRGQLPDPNECNSTLMSGTRGIYPYIYKLHIDVDERTFFHVPRASESNQENLGNDWKAPSAFKAVPRSFFHG